MTGGVFDAVTEAAVEAAAAAAVGGCSLMLMIECFEV